MEKLLNAKNLLNEKDECLLNKVKEVKHLKSLDSSVDCAKQLEMSKDQVVQLKTAVEEMKRIIKEILLMAKVLVRFKFLSVRLCF